MDINRDYLNQEKELIADPATVFDLLFKNSRMFAQFLIDESGKILRVSEGVEKNYGYLPADLEGKEFKDLFSQDDRNNGKPEQELKRVLEEGSSADLNFILHKNGSLVWSDGETVTVKIKEDQRYFIKTIQSVDEQKLIDQMLNIYEGKPSFLSVIFDSFVSGMEVFKSIRNPENGITDFKYIFVNSAAEKIMGRNRKDLLGKGLLTLYPDLKKIGIFDLQKRVVETGKPEKAEFNYKQNLNKWFKATFTKFGDGIITTFEDITGQKSANEELEKTTTFLLESQNLSHVCNFEWDVMNDKITGTPSLYQLFGFERNEATLFEFLGRVHENDREKVQYAFLNALNNRNPYEIEFKITLPGGTLRTVVERARIVFDENNKPVKIIGAVADITNIKNVEGSLKSTQEQLNKLSTEKEIVNERSEELLISNKQLIKIIEELDKYAYIVSHDLRSPLNSMEGLIFLLGEEYKNKSINKEGEEMLEMINTKIQNMKDLITQVLRAAKEDKKIKEPVNLYSLVIEVVEMLNPPSHFHVFLAHNLPHVKYHRTSLRQVFQNLISNAIKYMDKKQPLISISSLERASEYEIRVCDNGMGIPNAKLDKIFNVYEVAHENENLESHGLGLSIVKKIVEDNGGSIWVESKEGQETNFYFTIPKV
jgi:PAS domain S-box-containing protein